MATTTANILDVTVLDPRQKHPTIFRKFDELTDGEELIIHNDHDPKPLYYQLLNERGQTFKWEYLEEGPVWWKVRITKNSDEGSSQTVGQIAANDLRKAAVFRKYGIDFCCGGKKTLTQVCNEKGLDAASIQRELQETTVITQRPLEFNTWTIDFLADYITNTHHAYVKRTLPEIRNFAYKVATVHGSNHPELIEVHQLVEQLNEELMSHLEKEEQILFPYTKQLEAVRTGKQSKANLAGAIQHPIAVMELEHDEAGVILSSIRRLTNGYEIPDDACASYSLLYRTLEEFESDLHIHIHLENNILFPKAIELESTLLQAKD